MFRGWNVKLVKSLHTQCNVIETSAWLRADFTPQLITASQLLFKALRTRDRTHLWRHVHTFQSIISRVLQSLYKGIIFLNNGDLFLFFVYILVSSDYFSQCQLDQLPLFPMRLLWSSLLSVYDWRWYNLSIQCNQVFNNLRKKSALTFTLQMGDYNVPGQDICMQVCVWVCSYWVKLSSANQSRKKTSEELTEKNREVWKKDDLTLVNLNSEGERTWINTH